MRHPGRDKSATVVRKCAVSEVDDTKNEATDMDSWNVTKSSEGKNEAQYETCSCDGLVGGEVLWLNTAWSGRLGTSVGTTNCLRLQRQNCWLRPRSWQAFQNNGAHLPDPMAARCELLRFSRLSQTTAVVMFIVNHCGSHVHHHENFIHLQSDIECKWDFEIKVMLIVNILFAMLQA